jgi:hypothetical protein
VTGLGGTRLEPHVPSTTEVLRQLDPLIAAFRGEPERVLWRFDPLLKGITTLEGFAALAAEFSCRGVTTCIFSFPSYLSLKGPLDEQYQRHGLSRWERSEKREFALRLAETAGRFGLKLQACAQPTLIEDTRGAIQPACCISADLAQRLHPRRIPLELPKDPAQRKHCHCVKSDDIGHYTDRCGSGCVYCYSSAGGESNQSRIDPV